MFEWNVRTSLDLMPVRPRGDYSRRKGFEVGRGSEDEPRGIQKPVKELVDAVFRGLHPFL